MSKPKIVVLDSYSTTMDDLSWDALSKLGELTVYPRTPRELIAERASSADIILTNKVPIFSQELDLLPNLKFIAVLATGYNNVDLLETRKRGIPVANIPSYSTNSVAQNAFAHILSFACEIEAHSIAVKDGKWSNSPDMNLCVRPTRELAGLVLGVIGYGAIGSKVAEIARAFGMKVLAFAPSRKIGTSLNGVDFVSCDEIFNKADVISLNCPLNNHTQEIINAKNISKMKQGVWIINTGRGGLINERDLADALKCGRVGAAGVDVLSVEPPTLDNPLLSAKNCRISSHIAWSTPQARKRLIDIATGNVEAFLKGVAVNIVN